MTNLVEREHDATAPPTITGDAAVEARPGRGRGMSWLAIVLALALAGLGAWVIVDRVSQPSTAPSDQVDQLMDDYLAAWNDYDGDAFLQLVTDDYLMTTQEGSITAPVEAIYIDNLGAYRWHVTEIGERIMAGSGPWYVVQSNEIESTLYREPIEGLTVLTVVDDGGTLRVANHTYFGDF